MKNTLKLENLLPKYSWLPIVMAFATNGITYFVTRLFTSSREHYGVLTGIDEVIPFVPAFIVIYVGAFLFWGIGYWRIAYADEQLCMEIITADIIAKLICFMFFVITPTSMVRPDIIGEDIFSQLTGLIYFLDEPNNLFPSIHCLESWACFRGVAKIKDCNVWFKVSCFAMAVAVFMSTLFVKQHLFLDVIAGVAVFEIGLLICKRFSVYKVLYRINHKFGIGIEDNRLDSRGE